MKKTFHQIAQGFIENATLSDFDCRTVLDWFGNSSLYFSTEQEKNLAIRAFIWLYQHIAPDDGVPLDPIARSKCIAAFSEEFSLSGSAAERLFADYVCNANVTKPVIVGIEGLDGSGKTVQAKKLGEALRQNGKKVCVIDFPQYASFFGREIGVLLSDKSIISAMQLDEKSMCLWYALDRWKAVKDAQIGEYDYVIFNRYTLSSVVYQSARRYRGLNREFADWIFELEHKQLMLPVPDIYIYLDAGLEFCGENVLRKDERVYVDGLDVYEKSQDLLSCCRGIYKRLSDEIDGIIVLKCIDTEGRLRGMEEIGSEIIAVLTEYGLYI